jgi:hypothetical protein
VYPDYSSSGGLWLLLGLQNYIALSLMKDILGRSSLLSAVAASA